MRRSVFWLLDHYAEHGPPVAQIHRTAVAHASLADELGYEAVWLAEHHFPGLGTCPNPAVLLAAIAQQTERIRLGPAVSVLPLRNPTQVAEDYAMVDALSDGRLNLGVGTGSREGEFAGFGIDFAGRRARFDSALEELRSRLHRTGRACAADLNVPTSQPRVPIYVGTLSEEGAFRAGAAGLPMMTLAVPLSNDIGDATDRLAAHANGLVEAGLEPESVDAVLAVVAFAAATDDEARRIGAPALGRFLGALTATAPDDDGADIFDHVQGRGLGILGSPERVRGQLTRLADAGVRHVAFLSSFGGMPVDAADTSLRLLAPGV